MAVQAKGNGDVDDEELTAPGVQPGRAVGFHARLAGVGPSKLEKYGEAVLAVLVESTTL